MRWFSPGYAALFAEKLLDQFSCGYAALFAERLRAYRNTGTPFVPEPMLLRQRPKYIAAMPPLHPAAAQPQEKEATTGEAPLRAYRNTGGSMTPEPSPHGCGPTATLARIGCQNRRAKPQDGKPHRK